MRPQDIAILLKIVAIEKDHWQLTDISSSLFISISEVSESLNRSRLAGLIDYDKKRINRQNLMDFIQHGIKYVFPQKPGAIVRGIATAHSHPDIKKRFISEVNYVWPDSQGDITGQMIEPLYPKLTYAVKHDAIFYKLMALTDLLRVGKVREIKFAVEQLKKYLLK